MSEQERLRVPIPVRVSFEPGDIAASVPSVRCARRFTLDVAEDALEKLGPMAIQHFTERLAEQVVYENAPLVREVMLEYLRKREWAEPLIRELLREAIHDYVGGIFAPLRKGAR